MAHAQSPLSLSEAVQQGLANNYDIRVERLNVEIDRNNNNWGEAGRYPTINLQLSQTNNSSTIDNPTSFVQGTTVARGVTPAATASWVLFDGFRANISKSRLEQLQAESEGSANIVVQNTVQAIILGYYTAVFERERQEVLQRTLQVSREKYTFVQLKKELGSSVTTEVLLEEGNYLTDSLNVINQELIYRNAVRNLNFLMGVENVDTDYLLADSLAFADQAFTYDDLVAKMENNNVNLQTQYLTQSILQENLALIKSDLYPQLTFNATYSQANNRQNLEKAEFLVANPDRPLIVDTKNRVLNYNFVLTFNLFDGGRIKRAIQNARTNLDIGMVQIERLKHSLYRDLLSELDLYNNRRQQKSIAARRKAAAEQNMELSLEQYRTGTINAFDYRDIQIQYLQAAFGDLQATFNLLDSHTTLMRLTGGILDERNE